MGTPARIADDTNPPLGRFATWNETDDTPPTPPGSFGGGVWARRLELNAAQLITINPPPVGPITVRAPQAVDNGVIEPGETVAIRPTWKNTLEGTLALTGTGSDLKGPAGGTYTLDDTTADYGSIEERCKEAAGRGKLLGVGIGSTLDSGTNNFGQSTLLNPELQFSGNNEAASVKLDIFGEVVVTLGTVPQGQGHETTAAQVVADILGCSPEQVNVRRGHDTWFNSHAGFSGTYASQFAFTGLGAVKGAAELVREDLGKAVSKLKQEPGKGLGVAGVTLPLALAELGLIDEYEFIVHPMLAGHGPTLFAGLSKPVDLKLVSRLEYGSGAVAMRYEARR